MFKRKMNSAISCDVFLLDTQAYHLLYSLSKKGLLITFLSLSLREV